MDVGVLRPSGSCLRLNLGELATFGDLRVALKMLLGIKKSRQRLVVDSTIVSSQQTLGSVARGTPLEVTLVVAEPVCSTCGSDGPLLFCAGCVDVLYCGARCQRADWRRHSADCRRYSPRHAQI